MEDAAQWMRANAIPLATVEAGSGFADLAPLRGLIGKARIVSLGEATHGTREFFQLKHRLLEYCVSELGFNIFGIEASYPESLRVNDYVLNGKGNPADALTGMRFWTWDTEEVLALIEWLRAWNGAHDRQVKFYGFDMQSPTEAALGMLDYLRRVAPELAVESEEPLWPLCDDVSSARFHLLPAERRDAARARLDLILGAFMRERRAWCAMTGDLDWQLAWLNAVVLDQGAHLRSDASASRDIAMAENVAALLEIEGPGAKAVLWAHNGHCARESSYTNDDQTPVPNMGSRLHELFGRQHVVVGFAFNQGSFQAMASERGLVDHSVAPAPAGSLDHALAATEIPKFLLDLRSAPAGPVAEWLASKPLSRWIGATYAADRAQDLLQPLDPSRAFDVLAFVETTSAARANGPGRRPPDPKREPARAATNLELAGTGHVPDAWTATNPHRAHAHAVALADVTSPKGGRTVCIARSSAPWRWGEGRLSQTFAAEDWRGKRLHLGAAVRAEVSGRGNGAYIYLEALPKAPEGVAWQPPAVSAALPDRPVRWPRWERYAVAIDVPEAADVVVIGLALAGNGAAWFGDIELSAE